MSPVRTVEVGPVCDIALNSRGLAQAAIATTTGRWAIIDLDAGERLLRGGEGDEGYGCIVWNVSRSRVLGRRRWEASRSGAARGCARVTCWTAVGWAGERAWTLYMRARGFDLRPRGGGTVLEDDFASAQLTGQLERASASWNTLSIHSVSHPLLLVPIPPPPLG